MADFHTASPAAGQTNLQDLLTQQTQRSQLEFGARLFGEVVAVDAVSGTYTVKTHDPEQEFFNCIWLAGMTGSLLGFNLTGLLTPGTGVWLRATEPAIIEQVASLDPAPPADSSHPREVTGTGLPRQEVYPRSDRPTPLPLGGTPAQDLLLGDFEIGSQLGPFIQMLTYLVKLGAGERAKIETCVLNDMVRVVSGLYRHHSAFGDFEIYEDGGQVNVLWNGTSYTHEAWGTLEANSPKAEVEDGKVKPESVAETGRWRFTQLMGWIGDFIHEWVTEPENALGSLAQNRAGKSHFWRGSDGTVLIQSVGEIALERVHRVLVPINLKHWSDPTGQLTEEFAALERDPLTQWDFGVNLENTFETILQLRCYARWLNQYHSLARILQMTNDWEVTSEAEAPVPDYSNREPDVEAVNGPQAVLERYSTIRIMRDGSHVFYDGHGNAYVTSPRGIHLSSVRDFTVEAAGDIRMEAGRNMVLKARRNIDILAMVGGLTLKCRTWFKAICEWGSMYLKGNSYAPGSGWTVPTVADDQPLPDDPAPEILPHAILLDAEVGDIGIHSGRRIHILAEGEGLHESEEGKLGDVVNRDASLILEARRQDVALLGKRNVVVSAQGTDEGTGVVTLTSREFLQQATERIAMETQVWALNRSTMEFNREEGLLRVSRLVCRNLQALGSVSARSVRATSVAAGSVAAAAVAEGGDPPSIDFPEFTFVSTPVSNWLSQAKPNAPVPQWGVGQRPLWGYEPSQYLRKGEGLYQSLSQQRLVDDTSLVSEAWELTQDQLKRPAGVLRVATNLKAWPWPGKSVKHKVIQSPELPPLHQLNTSHPVDSFKPATFARQPRVLRIVI